MILSLLPLAPIASIAAKSVSSWLWFWLSVVLVMVSMPSAIIVLSRRLRPPICPPLGPWLLGLGLFLDGLVGKGLLRVRGLLENGLPRVNGPLLDGLLVLKGLAECFSVVCPVVVRFSGCWVWADEE